VSPLTASSWQKGPEQRLGRHRYGAEPMIDGRGPRAEEVIRLRTPARTLKISAEQGEKLSCRETVAEKIVAAIAEARGLPRLQDLVGHSWQWVEPIRTRCRGYDIWDCPPNGQGLTVPLALHTCSTCGFAQLPAESTDRFHLLVEAVRLAFAHGQRHVTDPGFSSVPAAELPTRPWEMHVIEADSRSQATDRAACPAAPERSSVGVCHRP
jgi:gamma-glutamyltranspeptidase/glutathione hydrolase